MVRRSAVPVGIGLAAAVIAIGTAVSSNIAFKFPMTLNAPAASGGVGVGKQIISLPYQRKPGVDNALQLMQDIGGGNIAPVASVSRFNTATDSFTVYTGRMGSNPSTPFSLVAGAGYYVQMTSNANYVIVGSHASSVSLTLSQPTSGISATGKHIISVPYNSTATNALQLMQDIGGGSIAAVASVSRYVSATDSFQVYTGRMGSNPITPFDVVPGEAYYVSITSTVTWTPSHY